MSDTHCVHCGLEIYWDRVSNKWCETAFFQDSDCDESRDGLHHPPTAAER